MSGHSDNRVDGVDDDGSINGDNGGEGTGVDGSRLAVMIVLANFQMLMVLMNGEKRYGFSDDVVAVDYGGDDSVHGGSDGVTGVADVVLLLGTMVLMRVVVDDNSIHDCDSDNAADKNDDKDDDWDDVANDNNDDVDDNGRMLVLSGPSLPATW